MATPAISTKRVAISKANAQIVAVVAAASFISVFCLVASQAVWSQNKYQARVISQKEKARDQLKSNLEAFNGLAKSYEKFNSADPNIINGARGGSGDNDGSNAKIVLDALPSSYDFPALTSSIEKILKDSGANVSSIAGTDDGSKSSEETATPKATEIPFSFTISDANYNTVKQLMQKLQTSIRPIQIDILDISGGGNRISVTVNAHTFYQPAKSVKLSDKVVK